MCPDPSYYQHQSTGLLHFEFGKGTRLWQPWWALVICDAGIVDFYAKLAKKHGRPIEKNYVYGAHISFNKGEEPPNKPAWLPEPIPIAFRYASTVRSDNARHAWLDVWSDDLIAIRQTLGFPPKLKMSYHLTLGRLT